MSPPRACRPIRIKGDLAYISLTKGYEAVIDAADVHLVSGFTWIAHAMPGKSVYACSQQRFAGGGGQKIFLHRLIANTPLGMFTDHIDRDTLNNRRANLRHATNKQNTCNSRAPRTNTSGKKGVVWDKRYSKWRARIGVDGRRFHLGYYDSIEAAAAAYAAGSLKFHGEFGRVA